MAVSRLPGKSVGYVDALRGEPGPAAEYTGLARGRLSQAIYGHISATGLPREECGCNGGLALRGCLEQHSPQAVVHVGLVASGEGHDAIAQRDGTGAMEMGGAGVHWIAPPRATYSARRGEKDTHTHTPHQAAFQRVL